ncbi:4-alpha-glucanotransferase [Puniceicoccus vermicola]|uniref:4-alpha-glucanotransferase n=1 Tax=Puniceicoccus vermicola TaxID=388746 RepID=A0A7X1AWV1_9BACT|nr:4-alpha-glucanotransferase [Puniceicoccus vermicola]MBC2601480.1 4-alpha-glucanotransferase [Puniceicoccus vermicola]
MSPTKSTKSKADSPLFAWPNERYSGVLLHPTALPGSTGIGTLGAEAVRFVDFLADSGFSLWQTCPLGPTGYGDSPYQCLSAFAGNPYLVDLDELIRLGLLYEDEVESSRTDPGGAVDYGALWHLRPHLLHLASERIAGVQDRVEDEYGSVQDFEKEQASWLEPYALFRALKEHFDSEPWYEWPEDYRAYERATEQPLDPKIQASVDEHKFTQYLFFGQWKKLRNYAASKGVRFIGDIPIFVALDGADAWQHPEFFQLDQKLQPLAVAGVPPDYFSETGQLWGNPLYDWKALKKDNYRWWMDRFRLNFELFDLVRIDHFRGFEAAYRIPADAEDARNGEWEKGPGLSFFKELQKNFPEPRVILEDLGVITPEVDRLRQATGLPGMSVLHFAFDNPSNVYLPHNLQPCTVLYPGSHDNDTTVGWYESEDEAVRDYVRRYLRVSGEEIAWDFIRAGYQSVANLFVVPFQDLLSLGTEARFNTPGTAVGNWSWRASPEMVDRVHGESSDYLKELSSLYNRNTSPKQ